MGSLENGPRVVVALVRRPSNKVSVMNCKYNRYALYQYETSLCVYDCVFRKGLVANLTMEEPAFLYAYQIGF
jgi:hypothetical protein